ncbi:Na-translocating system protein MpsC family protein [Anaerobacillus isosaccharinicus]|uniref:Na-translocating system protein MpsC family protein n=1 Tax=Anaerobacillus isosaccharinicus TaxID=1532552 RepID=A0A7S7L8I7_9BACI|nr:Na-translocating system protein MpsC family protein [Anaerobacillus isosaccharinicus]MBA5585237.1 DUF2294 family protein [Anaerobacillus isosaccharinicus]QOY36429.1 DUF2294 family protein [Anaerobacillus isosaccharinicus]
MNSDMQSAQKEISSFTGSLLRENFGKGPESVFVQMAGKYLTIYIRNFLSPIEKVLQQQDQDLIIDEMRQKLMYALIHDIRAFINAVTGVQIEHIYYDWNMTNRSGMIFAIGNEIFYDTVVVDNYHGKEEVEQKISTLSKEAEKTPEKITSFQMNSRTIAVIRTGILVRIEKEIIRYGKETLLKVIKRSLEKGYLHNSTNFEAILDKKVHDIFVDWDFELDESTIVIITEA